MHDIACQDLHPLMVIKLATVGELSCDKNPGG
jgi:hypothetical protein